MIDNTSSQAEANAAVAELAGPFVGLDGRRLAEPSSGGGIGIINSTRAQDGRADLAFTAPKAIRSQGESAASR